jgi:hypothetical protein
MLIEPNPALGLQMRRLFRKHEQDGLYLIAALCLIGVGLMSGAVLADLALLVSQ